MSTSKLSTNNLRNFERMVVELSPYMNDYEVDKCVEFCSTVSTSKFDINPTVEDSKSQMRIILGTERYWDVVRMWNEKNQHMLKENGVRKLKRISDGTLWDGLDPEDNPSDYVEVYI